jgi:hypothetical protein
VSDRARASVSANGDHWTIDHDGAGGRLMPAAAGCRENGGVAHGALSGWVKPLWYPDGNDRLTLHLWRPDLSGTPRTILEYRVL